MRNDTRYTQFEDISADSFLGRLTSDGPAIVLSATEATSLLDVFTSTDKGLVPFSGGGTINFLRADGTWAVPPGGGSISDGDRGDITVSGSGSIWTIDSGVVTFAKMQSSASGLSVIGRSSNSGGVFAEIAAASDGGVLRRSGTSIAFGTIGTLGIGDSQVTYAKIQSVTSARILGRYTGSTGVVQEITIGSGLTLDSGSGVLTSTPVSDGDKGDITVSSSGATWTVDLSINKAWSGVQSYVDNGFRLFNPANTSSYNFRTSAIAANRDVTLPLLTSADTIVFNDFTATLTNKTLGTGTVFSVIPVINDGITFTFNPNATLSGINVGSHASDPSSPNNGDIYYNSTSDELRARIAGSWIALGASGGTVSGSGTAGQIAYWTAGSIISSEAGFEYDSTNNRMIVPTIRGTAGTFTLASNNGTGAFIQLTDAGAFNSSSTSINFITGSSSLSLATGAIGIYSASVDIGNLATNIMNYTAASNRLRFQRGGVSPVNHVIAVTSGDATTNDGDSISLQGGNAYTVSGNGDGGNITLTSGERRTAGSGVDGNIILDPLTGSVLVNTVTGAAKLQVKGGGTGSSATFLTQKSDSTQTFEIVDNGNVGIGQGTYGSGVGVVSIAVATTPPSSNPTNSIVLYVKDVAGTAELYTKSETGSDVCLSGLFDPLVVTGTSLTLDDDDHRGKFIYFTNGSAITVTVPNTLKIGFTCVLMQDGGGTVSITGSGGTTINGKTSTTGQYDSIGLLHYKDTDVYFGR